MVVAVGPGATEVAALDRLFEIAWRPGDLIANDERRGGFIRRDAALDRVDGGDGTTGNDGAALGGGLGGQGGGSADRHHVTLSNNRAEGGASTDGDGGRAEGAGWYANGGDVVASHLTVVGNTASAGAGVASGSASGGGVRLTTGSHIASSIFADNSIAAAGNPPVSEDCSTSGPIDSRGYNLVEVPGGCSFAGTGDQIGGEPGLAPLGGSDCVTQLPGDICLPVHPVRLDGAALDQGSWITSGATADARGFARPFDFPTVADADNGCDPGAYETRDEDGNGIDDCFEILIDGFESGDTSKWSASMP